MNGKRLYHSVAEQIKALISQGTFPPGSRLPGERELAEQFDVSRVTIREAEIALQALGYISIKTGSGAYVLDPAENVHHGLPNVSAFELTEARLIYEAEAAALAAQHISDETLERLEKLLEVMITKGRQNQALLLKADHEFHLAIAAASGNTAVKYIVETLWRMRGELPEVRDVHSSICAVEDKDVLHKEHAQVLDALRARDPAAARQAMQEHFRSLLESMLDVTEEQALKAIREQATQSRQRYLSGISN
jgi:DNA-binding FadR family transcriptional regulator